MKKSDDHPANGLVLVVELGLSDRQLEAAGS